MKKDSRGHIFAGIETTCKYCNSNNVFWYKTKEGKWILYDGHEGFDHPTDEKTGKRILYSSGNDFHKCIKEDRVKIQLIDENGCGNILNVTWEELSEIRKVNDYIFID